jgi:tRNA threonylcarbamoyladenosine dehydratase
MASFFHDAVTNHRFQLFATAVISGATIATLLLGYQALEREERLSELKSSIPSLTDRGHNVKQVHSLSPIYVAACLL